MISYLMKGKKKFWMALPSNIQDSTIWIQYLFQQLKENFETLRQTLMQMISKHIRLGTLPKQVVVDYL